MLAGDFRFDYSGELGLGGGFISRVKAELSAGWRVILIVVRGPWARPFMSLAAAKFDVLPYLESRYSARPLAPRICAGPTPCGGLVRLAAGSARLLDVGGVDDGLHQLGAGGLRAGLEGDAFAGL